MKGSRVPAALTFLADMSNVLLAPGVSLPSPVEKWMGMQAKRLVCLQSIAERGMRTKAIWTIGRKMIRHIIGY